MLLKKRWSLKLKDIDEKKILYLVETLKIDRISAKLLLARGIDSYEEGKKFLKPDILSDLYSPFLFKDMLKTIARIRKSIEKGEKIAIYGDRDVDGISSASLLYDALVRLKANVMVRVPTGDDGYGLSDDIVEELKKEDVKLLITVDNGITAFDAVDRAGKYNIDVIITDHHTPSETLPSAYAIINPKCDNNYPFKDLSGAGVAFKLVIALFFSYSRFFNKEIVVLDLETTGTDTEKDEIIEIGAIKLKNFLEVDTFHSYIKPRSSISDEITEITGIKKNMLENQPDIGQVLPDFYNFIKNSILVGHNIKEFDIKFINRELKKNFNITLSNELIDTLEISKKYIPSISHKLENMARYFNINIDGKFHTALYDSKVTLEIFKRFYQLPQSLKRVLYNYSQYAALGTLADIMPLLDENRVIVKIGIEQLKNSEIPGLVTLFSALGLSGKDINSLSLAWKVLPVLNAAGRMGLAEEALKLFISTDIKEIREIVNKLLELNRARKEKQDYNFGKIMEILERKVDTRHDKIFIIDIDNIEHGVTGVIANRIKDIYNRPVAILIVKDGKGMGTARSIKSFPLYENFNEIADIFEQFGGHKYAVGFTIKEENISLFKDKLKEIAEKKIKEEDLIPEIDIDIKIENEEFNIDTIKRIENLFEPFGETNPEPVFWIKGLKLIDMKSIGMDKNHLKLRVLYKDKIYFDAIWWSNYDKADNIKIGKAYDIVGKFKINEWNNNESITLIIEDLKEN